MLALLCSFFHHEYSPLHSTPPSILALSSPPLFPFFLHSLYIDAYNHLDSLFFSFLLLDCLLSVYINENIKSSARFTHPLLPFVSYFITRYHRHKILIFVALRSFSRAYTHPFKASRFKFLLWTSSHPFSIAQRLFPFVKISHNSPFPPSMLPTILDTCRFEQKHSCRKK